MKKNFFSRDNQLYAKVREKNFFPVLIIVASCSAVITATIVWVLNSYLGLLTFIPLYFLSDVAIDAIIRQKLLTEIKSWVQSRKDESLYNEVKGNNLENVKVLLRCGANVNGIVTIYDWAMDRDGDGRTYRPLDAARTPEMENFLKEQGAVRFSENSKRKEVI